MPIALMLANLTDRRELGDDWLLERKFDGERCIAREDGRDVRLESRTGKNITCTYPEVRAAVAAQRDRELLLDGEVVAFDGEPTSFSRLQAQVSVRRCRQPTAGRMAVIASISGGRSVRSRATNAHTAARRAVDRRPQGSARWDNLGV